MNLFLTAVLMLIGNFPWGSNVFQNDPDVFVPIGKYIESGDSEKLSAWFAPTIEIDVLGRVSECSKPQAMRIMHDFFEDYTPKSFIIIHKSGRAPMKYAIGELDAGGDKFRITLFVKIGESGNFIQQIRIGRE